MQIPALIYPDFEPDGAESRQVQDAVGPDGWDDVVDGPVHGEGGPGGEEMCEGREIPCSGRRRQRRS